MAFKGPFILNSVIPQKSQISLVFPSKPTRGYFRAFLEVARAEMASLVSTLKHVEVHKELYFQVT